jgi:prophage antirepressor-like protein
MNDKTQNPHNQLTPFQFQSLPLRVVADENGNPWFCGIDACGILGYANDSKAIKDHCKKDGVTNRYPIVDSMGRTQYPNFIHEGNLYRLIIKSNKPEAEPFESWVCDEVLPTIRKTGAYAVADRAKEPRAKMESKIVKFLEGKPLGLSTTAIGVDCFQGNSPFPLAEVLSGLLATGVLAMEEFPRADGNPGKPVRMWRLSHLTLANLPDPSSLLERCKVFMAQLVALGPVEAKAGLEACLKAGFSEKTIERARLALGMDCWQKAEGGWMWQKPEGEPWLTLTVQEFDAKLRQDMHKMSGTLAPVINALVVNGQMVRQDPEGRYLLNDLHRASGHTPRHQPNEWRRTEKAKAAVKAASRKDFKAIVSIHGFGTYAARPLALAYAEWVGKEFHAMVREALGYVNALQPALSADSGDDDAQINFRMPRGLKGKVDALAKANGRSRNGEIVHWLEQATASPYGLKQLPAPNVSKPALLDMLIGKVLVAQVGPGGQLSVNLLGKDERIDTHESFAVAYEKALDIGGMAIVPKPVLEAMKAFQTALEAGGAMK